MSSQPDFWRPALISGAIFGFLSGLPIIDFLNCLCCAWVVSAGVLTSWMMVRSSGVMVTYATAAIGGAIAGAVAAIVSGFLKMLLMLVLRQDFAELVREAAERSGQLFPGSEDALRVLEGITGPVLLSLVTLITMVIYAPFGLAGGALGRAIFEKRTPPPPEAPAPTLDTMKG